MPTTYVPSFNLRSEFPQLAESTTVRLHPRVGSVGSVLSSKIGGVIGWPDGNPWPACDQHGTSLVPVVQLTRDDVPELPFPSGTDTFQLLWCPRDHEQTAYAPLPKVFWWQGQCLAQSSKGLTAPPDADPNYLPHECTVAPERVEEFPSAFVLDLTLVERLDRWIADNAAAELATLGIAVTDDEIAAYQYHFSVAPGTKVGGHVAWIQDEETPTCDCGSRMIHLLTIGSAEFDGSYQRWLPLEERHVWSAPYESRRRTQAAAGLMLGDAGSLFVFYCSACGPGQVKAISQCS